MKRLELVGMLVGLVALAGCEAMGTAAQSKTTQGAVLGGLLGAGTGAIVGNQSDNAGAGTAIGAGLGALGGGLIGHALEEQEKALQQQQYPPAVRSAPVLATKFCPVGGETYPNASYPSADMRYCPIHGVELRNKEP